MLTNTIITTATTPIIIPIRSLSEIPARPEAPENDVAFDGVVGIDPFVVVPPPLGVGVVVGDGSAMLHVTPEYPAAQAQEKVLTRSEHGALFSQGLVEQSSTSIEQVVPL